MTDIETDAARLLELWGKAGAIQQERGGGEALRILEHERICTQALPGCDCLAGIMVEILNIAPGLALGVLAMSPVVEAAAGLDERLGDGLFEDSSDPAEKLGAPPTLNPRLMPAVEALETALDNFRSTTGEADGQ